VTIGEDLLEERRRRRRAGYRVCPTLTARSCVGVTRGDPADAFQAALDADLE